MMSEFLLDKEKPLLIDGPSGNIEAIVEQLTHDEQGSEHSKLIAIACHPHPLHGGNMNNKVVTTVARAFQEIGAFSIRFNYRGVGNSDGIYGDLAGEAEDAAAVLNWVKKHFPNYKIALAGFSFGGAVAIRVAQQHPVHQLVTIAPAAYLIDYDLNVAFDFPWLLVHGWEDEVIKIEGILDWCKSLKNPPEMWCLPHASHFFHGKLVCLKKKLIDYLQSGA